MSYEYEHTIEEEETPDLRKKKFWKFWLVMLTISIGFLAIIVRLVFVQIVDADVYRAKAKEQHERRVNLSADRGKILDRNSKLLASSVQSLSIAVDPEVLENKTEVARQIADILDFPYSEVSKKVNKKETSFVWIARGIPPHQAIKLEAIEDRGLIKIYEPRRNYLFGSVGSQIIGCTDIDNQGITGVELGLDSLLSGRSGYMMMFRDGIRNLHSRADLPVVPAQHGLSVRMTIDIELQRIVEYELMVGVESTGSETGTVIAMDPKTGEILAMASYPTYHPMKRNEATTGSLRIRSITDVYEPGSTFKLITAAAALEEKEIQTEDTVDGMGGLADYGEYVIRDSHPIGKVTFRESFEESSNVVFSTVAHEMKSNIFYKYIRDFGFGLKLGFDLPGEVSGMIKKPKEFDPSTKRFMGFGYEVAVTPLQLVNAYAAIANEGNLMKPYIVKSIETSDGSIIREYEPEKIRQVISEEVADTLISMLLGVVDIGTGKSARIDGIPIAGKTGTSQQLTKGVYSKSNYNASFAGFFPADDPKIAMIVILDRPQGDYYGGSTAAPIFRNIALRWAAVSSDVIVKNDEEEDDEKKIKDTLEVPNLTGFSPIDAKEFLESVGFNSNLTGDEEGLVVDQEPDAGTKSLEGIVVMAILKDQSGLAQNNNKDRPDVIGLTARRAVTILHDAGLKVKIEGSGIVKKQKYTKNSKGEIVCTITCR
jgi:cell division protein FtsI (penicillin-binding protein 3)